MARPKKNNADYFSHDCDMRNDVRIKALRRKFSHTGYAVWNYLLEEMTNSDFFEVEWSEISIELLSADFDVSTSELIDIADYCVKIGLFILEDNILFSNTLKKRFSSLLSKRERDSKRIIVNENPAKTPEKIVIDSENPHSKVKESKVKESKEKNKKEKGLPPFYPPSLTDVEEYVSTRERKINAVAFVNFYQSKGWMVGKNKMKDWRAAVRTWEAKEKSSDKKEKYNGQSKKDGRTSFDSDEGLMQHIAAGMQRGYEERERTSGGKPL